MVLTSSVRLRLQIGREIEISNKLINRQFLPNQATRKIGITPVHTMIHASGAST